MPTRLSLSVFCNISLLTVGIFFLARHFYLAPPYVDPVVANKKFYDSVNLSRIDFYNAFKLQRGDIVFVGTSITEGFPLADAFPHLPVKNRGIGGNQTGMVLTRINDIAKAHPSKLFLECGINDIRSGYNIEMIMKNYRAVVDAIKTTSPETKIFAQSVLPVSAMYDSYNSGILKLDSALKDFCSSSCVSYLDLYRDFKNDKYLDLSLTPDGIHLNGKGYALLASKLKPFVD